MAQEAATVAETSAYERGVLDTEARLTAEVTVVCRKYYAETYNQALDQAKNPCRLPSEESGLSVLPRGP